MGAQQPSWVGQVVRDEPVIVGAAVSALVSAGAITSAQGSAWQAVAADAVTLLVHAVVAVAVRRRTRPTPPAAKGPST